MDGLIDGGVGVLGVDGGDGSLGPEDTGQFPRPALVVLVLALGLQLGVGPVAADCLLALLFLLLHLALVVVGQQVLDVVLLAPLPLLLHAELSRHASVDGLELVDLPLPLLEPVLLFVGLLLHVEGQCVVEQGFLQLVELGVYGAYVHGYME